MPPINRTRRTVRNPFAMPAHTWGPGFIAGDGVPIFNDMHTTAINNRLEEILRSAGGMGTTSVPTQTTAAEEIEMQRIQAEQQAREEELRREEARLNSLPITIRTEFVQDDGYEFFRILVLRDGQAIDEYHERSSRHLADSIRNIRDSWIEKKTHMAFSSLPKGATAIDVRADRFISRRDTNPRRIDRRAVRPADDVVTEDGLVLDIQPDEQVEMNYQESPPVVINDSFDRIIEELDEDDDFAF